MPLTVQLGPDGTIPEKLLQTVLVLARRTIFSRLPAQEGLHSELRDKEVESAEKTLQDCKRGEFRLEEPLVPAGPTEQGAVQTAVAVNVPPRLTRRGGGL